MAVLAANAKRNYDLGVDDARVSHFVIASDTIYEGAACSMASGADDVGPLNASNVFVGFALRKVANETGAASTVRVQIAQRGLLRGLAVTGATLNTAPGAAVYAVNDGTFDLASTGNLQIGKIVRGTGTDLADIYFEGAGVRSV